MARSTFLSVLTATSVLFAGASATLDPIVIKGNKFFYKTSGNQFFIKGVAYQAGISSNGSTVANNGYIDPLADTQGCTRDIPYLKQLGANTIRTYALDPTQNHDTCMSLLDAAGIYVLSDLGEPNLSIDRTNPQWNLALYNRYTSVVDTMSAYSNVIGFFAGNEVSNNLSYTGASAFVKAAIRDTKAHIAAKGYRPMGVGYAADDDADVRADVAAYFNCGDVADQIDFWGYNIYEWCGDATYESSGYANRTAEFTGYSVPAFFAEYGCNTQGGGAAGRKFTEVAALYGDQMSPVFSGGFVYEYFEETNDYGLASVDGSSVSTLADFNAWKTQIAAVSPKSTSAAAYSPTNTVGQSCPTVGANWQAASSPLPPVPNADVCNCMVASLTCVASSQVNNNGTLIGQLFGEVCSYPGSPCAGIGRNTTTGVYGAYSMCNATQQLSYAFDTYYKGQSSSSSACNFGGAAQIVKAAAANSCSSIIASATASNPVSGTSTGKASTTSKKSDASGITHGANLLAGKVFAVGFTITALLSGAGMILL